MTDVDILEAPASVRILQTRDMAAYAAHLSRLDPAAQAVRFHGQLSRAGLERMAATAVEQASFVAAALVGREIRGAAELWPSLDPAGRYEIALSTEDGWRNAGLEQLLIASAVDYALRYGGRELVYLARTCDPGAAVLTQRFGATWTWTSDAADILRLDLKPRLRPASIAGR